MGHYATLHDVASRQPCQSRSEPDTRSAGAHSDDYECEWPIATDHCQCVLSNLRKASGCRLQAPDLPELDSHVVAVGVPDSEQPTARRTLKVRWSTANDEIVVLDPDAVHLMSGCRQHPNIQQGVAQFTQGVPQGDDITVLVVEYQG